MNEDLIFLLQFCGMKMNMDMYETVQENTNSNKGEDGKKEKL